MLNVGRNIRQSQAPYTAQSLAVKIRDFDPSGVEAIELAQLHKADCGLYVGHAKVKANLVEIQIPVTLPHGLPGLVDRKVLALRVISEATQRPERKHTLVEVFAAGRDHAPFTQRDHVLLLMKTEYADVAQSSRSPAFVLRPGSVCAVFDDQNAAIARQIHNWIHLAALTRSEERRVGK